MRFMLLGSSGQLGWELQRALSPLGELVVCDRRQADFCQPSTLVGLVQQYLPDVIVNAAAYTSVDRAECDGVIARLVNADSVGVLAEQAKRLGSLLVHYSTDYIFDGSLPGFQSEDSPAGPLNVYGKTKLEGEQVIRSVGCRHLILRTSWVYAARGHNFIKTMLRLAYERDELRVVSDQVGAPTSAELIADISALMLHRMAAHEEFSHRAQGTYHLVASGQASWYEYATFVVKMARELGMPLKVEDSRILPVCASDFTASAIRPSNSRLNNRKLQAVFNVRLPHWQYHVMRMLQEIVPVDVVINMLGRDIECALPKVNELLHSRKLMR